MRHVSAASLTTMHTCLHLSSFAFEYLLQLSDVLELLFPFEVTKTDRGVLSRGQYLLSQNLNLLPYKVP